MDNTPCRHSNLDIHAGRCLWSYNNHANFSTQLYADANLCSLMSRMETSFLSSSKIRNSCFGPQPFLVLRRGNIEIVMPAHPPPPRTQCTGFGSFSDIWEGSDTLGLFIRSEWFLLYGRPCTSHEASVQATVLHNSYSNTQPTILRVRDLCHKQTYVRT